MMISSNYDEIDFAKLYLEQKAICSFKPKSADDWDKRAVKMNEGVKNSYYSDEFVKRMSFDASSSVLDVGCGPGTIGLKIASSVKNVILADFSAGMLEQARQNIIDRNITNATTMQLSFTDSWKDVPQCDIVVASRCLEVPDIKDALTKLISKARKSVYLTYHIGKSFLGDEISEILRGKFYPKPDYIYLINVLYGMRYRAKVDFISHNDCKFKSESFDDFIRAVEWSYCVSVSDEERRGLLEYYERNKLVTKQMNWAFIEIIL
ncbi:SAM-dependent methyltransferase [Campylobacter iguaniorum]|uniref:class I SAM-dependent methyltransferase n=1 Tax=Campylobacter iguaniorum TaxID=1244531 RepID=UPI00073A1E9C|nr:class I SAM-dependent methyltransferase [Campylobacter iguaniorum]ALV23903.1 SAM-dependent methyltransferase [Campylobacter iguaniorum]